MKCRFFLSVLILSLAVSCGPKDGIHTFYLCTTNDVHGRYFDSLYVGTDTKGSLLAVSRVVDSIRTACGDENVVLVDAGDCVQGDNASYYFNFVDTLSPHLYAEMANYMRYDAHVLGNHDIETGHPVYDRLRKQLKAPMLAANALRTDNGKAYFDEYAVIRRHGVRIAVIGFTNANIKNWLSPELWSGMEFERILPVAQETVDRVIEKEKPHVVIVAVHSGTGEGNGNSIENEGLDLFRTLEGVDFVVCAHDHRPAVFETDSISMINSGSHCRNIGFGRIDIETKDGKVISKALSTSLIPVDKEKTDTVMRERFRPQYEAVKAFTVKPVGELEVPLVTRLSYMGMSNYINFLHTINLQCSGAQVSFAAPLDFDGHIEPGRLVYNDLFTIYPFENQLFTVRMSGKEIKAYFTGGDLRQVDVIGNVRLGYFPVDGKDSTLIGYITAESSLMNVYLLQRKVQKIKMTTQTDGVMYPMLQIPEDKLYLPSFAWFDYIRPLNKDDVFRWRGKKAGQELKKSVQRKPPLPTLKGLLKK